MGKSTLLRAAKRITFCGCAVYSFTQYISCPWLLSEHSMEPTLSDGQVVLCSPWPWCGKVEKGDIVIAKNPKEPENRICKRIIGLSGDRVQDVLIPPGHMWLEGDNRDASIDSREYGPLPMGLLEGKVTSSLFPFSRTVNEKKEQLCVI